MRVRGIERKLARDKCKYWGAQIYTKPVETLQFLKKIYFSRTQSS